MLFLSSRYAILFSEIRPHLPCRMTTMKLQTCPLHPKMSRNRPFSAPNTPIDVFRTLSDAFSTPIDVFRTPNHLFRAPTALNDAFSRPMPTVLPEVGSDEEEDELSDNWDAV